MPQQSQLFIIASPRPRVGKTLIARLLLEFFRSENRPLVGFDLNTREPVLAGRYPGLAFPIDIADTRGQMALFDRLIAGNAVSAVIDVGDAAFEPFFAVVKQIGFAQEARRRSLEPIVLYVADHTPTTVRGYARLRELLPATAAVPVHNEAVSVILDKEDFPPWRPECRMVRIPRLSPIVRGVIDRPSFSFGAYVKDQRGGPTEIHAWIAGIFAEFRELELRLLMGRLSSALAGRPSQPAAPWRPPQR